MSQRCPDPEKTKLLYSTAEEPWPKDDSWHRETHIAIEKCIADFLRLIPIAKHTKLLNAGAGRTRYALECECFDCDLAEELLNDSVNPIIASIENIPIDNDFFDLCICVGSVINYCDLVRAITELSRVIKASGYLIVEFERSDSAEFLFTQKHHAPVFPMSYMYNQQVHDIWLYSEKYVRNALLYAGFEVVKVSRFHIASSLAYRLHVSQENAAKYIRFDAVMQAASYQLAHNALLLCRKVATSTS